MKAGETKHIDNLEDALDLMEPGDTASIHWNNKVVNIEIKKVAQELGKRGGQKTASLYGSEHYKKIAKGWPKGKPRKKKEENV